MRTPELSPKDWLVVGGVALIALVLLAAIRWRHDILQTTLDPKQPFQVYRPPREPNYAIRATWALLPAKPDQPGAGALPADVFFVHPTTFDGGRDWNGPIGDDNANRFLERVVLPNYAGPFQRVGRLFAPRYRQASVYTELTMRDDARESRAFAYGDVRRAFDLFADRYNQGRPIVLVGVEQGGMLVERLLREELAARPDLARRLAAVYLIDTVALKDDYGPTAQIPACASRGQPRCVVGWTQSFEFDKKDISSTYERSLVWDDHDHLVNLNGRPILCVNPLLGAASEERAAARTNLGAANATDMEWGLRPAFMSRQVSAQCVRGVLQVSSPASPSLKVTGSWVDRLKEPGFNLFYADLEADAQGRVAALLARP